MKVMEASSGSPMGRNFRIFSAYTRMSLKVATFYRFDFALRWLGYPAKLAMAFFLWRALARAAPGSQYNFDEIIAYYVFALFLSQLYSFVRFARDIREDIYSGDISLYVLRDVPYWSVGFARVLANVGLSSLMATPAIILLAFVLVGIQPTWEGYSWFLIFFLIGITLTFQTYYIIGLSTFFTEEIIGSLRLYQTVERFFGGAFLPLYLFPPVLKSISDFLPFRYWVYFPSQAILQPPDFLTGISQAGVGIIWIMILLIIGKWIWRRGWENYSGHSL